MGADRWQPRKNKHFVLVFPRNLLLLANFSSSFYDSIETQKMFSISEIFINDGMMTYLI